MRALLLGSLLLLGCNQLLESGDELEQDEKYTIDPAQEREAEEFNKLGVERDMLEAKLRSSNEALAEAEEELRDAKTSDEKKSATKQRRAALDSQRQAKQALDAFRAKY